MARCRGPAGGRIAWNETLKRAGRVSFSKKLLMLVWKRRSGANQSQPNGTPLRFFARDDES